MNKYFAHLRTVGKHRKLVRKLCFKCGYYKRGLLHDLSKYSPSEFYQYHYYQGTRSPIDAEKEMYGYSPAWLHHKSRNKHHWEYWTDTGKYGIFGVPIPQEYMIEMICDWVSASITYSGRNIDFDEPYDAPLNYYMAHLNSRIFEKMTEQFLRYCLKIIANEGINAFCRFAKNRRN